MVTYDSRMERVGMESVEVLGEGQGRWGREKCELLGFSPWLEHRVVAVNEGWETGRWGRGSSHVGGKLLVVSWLLKVVL